MKVSAVINANKLKNKKIDYKQPGMIVVFVCLTLGIVCGCIVYTVADNNLFSPLGKYFLSFATDFSNKNKPEIFSGLIISDLPYFIAMLVFGLSALGYIPVLLISFFKCAGIGAVATYLYTTYSLEGIEYCILILFPSYAVMVLAIMMLTHSCYVTGMKINKLIRNKDESDIELQKYFLRSGLIYCIFVVASVIRFVTIISFSSLFSFV